jgi:hypothetical protein
MPHSHGAHARDHHARESAKDHGNDLELGKSHDISSHTHMPEQTSRHHTHQLGHHVNKNGEEIPGCGETAHAAHMHVLQERRTAKSELFGCVGLVGIAIFLVVWFTVIQK